MWRQLAGRTPSAIPTAHLLEFVLAMTGQLHRPDVVNVASWRSFNPHGVESLKPELHIICERDPILVP